MLVCSRRVARCQLVEEFLSYLENGVGCDNPKKLVVRNHGAFEPVTDPSQAWESL